ncbi:MAG: 2-oxoacid:acceptor oxidoreductase family protein, partial [Acidimicrobiia bacterium]
EVIGAIGEDLIEEQHLKDEFGRPKEIIHVSANPKYGSEKKGAPTSYFLVAAPDRVRVNCDLHHVDVVLCPDPKIFTHTNPLEGLNSGGTFVWESEEDPETVWQRIPAQYRQEIIDKGVRIVTLGGFKIAREATDRPDLQLRMQGNAFLGAFFAVSGMLDEYNVTNDRYREIVRAQYVKKFGRFGDAVVESNMEVMTKGGDLIVEVPHGPVDAPDRSSMRLQALETCGTCTIDIPLAEPPQTQEVRIPLTMVSTFNREFKAGLGYNQPATPLSSVSMMAAGSGRGSSKYVARRETPVWIAENCTACMDCIVSCPDTALPNVAQDFDVVFGNAARGYILDPLEREKMVAALPDLEERVRSVMKGIVQEKGLTPFLNIMREEVAKVEGVSETARGEFLELFERVPFAYTKTSHLFRSMERTDPGSGGLFAIMVSDLCKGCGECVLECPWEALEMAPETPMLNADHVSGTNFLELLPDTPDKYLGRFDSADPVASTAAHLKNHLMVRTNYEALVSGDGACAGCGEKSILRTVASLTEAYMRPLYHAKADRLDAKAAELQDRGIEMLQAVKSLDEPSFDRLKRLIAHVLMGLGGETIDDTETRISRRDPLTDQDVLDALIVTLRQDAFNHRDLQALDGTVPNGMSVMAMGAHTGCNTVYGSTPPNNPHPYPWMNSLFQDGATVTWLLGESFIADHARRSVIPERLADRIELGVGISDDEYFEMTHMTDAVMTPREIRELPKAWAIGGDGGMGDIGYQNVSKVVLQNRPNVKLLLLDTQVYSNTGGQNSDSSPMPGGGDMNQFGAASEGKLTEKKGVAETFISGHGSAYVAQVSMANAAQFYKAMIEALDYRGTAFIQSYTSCQPEHGIADDVSTLQAGLVRDGRSMPQFVLNPQKGETYQETLDISGNPNRDRDWTEITSKQTDRTFNYTVAHFAATEARFRRHLRAVKDVEGLVHLEDMILLVRQNDVVQRSVLDPTHRSYVPDFGVYIEIEDGKGNVKLMALSRQLVLFCVERRKSWRMLQSKAGVTNIDYVAQRQALEAFDEDGITMSDRFGAIRERFDKALVDLS